MANILLLNDAFSVTRTSADSSCVATIQTTYQGDNPAKPGTTIVVDQPIQVPGTWPLDATALLAAVQSEFPGATVQWRSDYVPPVEGA